MTKPCLSLMEKSYTIHTIWCAKCKWFPPQDWSSVSDLALDDDGELITPCPKCGAWNPIEIERITREGEALNEIYGAMDRFIQTVFCAVGDAARQECTQHLMHEDRRVFVAYPDGHYCTETRRGYMPPIETICPRCLTKAPGGCPCYIEQEELL